MGLGWWKVVTSKVVGFLIQRLVRSLVLMKCRQEDNKENQVASSKMGNLQENKTEVLLVLYWSLIYCTEFCTYVWLIISRLKSLCPSSHPRTLWTPWVFQIPIPTFETLWLFMSFSSKVGSVHSLYKTSHITPVLIPLVLDAPGLLPPYCLLSWPLSELSLSSDALTRPLPTSGTQTATRAQHISWGQVPHPSKLRVFGVSIRSWTCIFTNSLETRIIK